MDDDWGNIWSMLIVGLIFCGIFGFLGVGGKSDKDKLQEALQEANDQIVLCNQQITDTKDIVWQDYDTMGRTIDNMENCEQITDPTKK